MTTFKSSHSETCYIYPLTKHLSNFLHKDLIHAPSSISHFITSLTSNMQKKRACGMCGNIHLFRYAKTQDFICSKALPHIALEPLLKWQNWEEESRLTKKELLFPRLRISLWVNIDKIKVQIPVRLFLSGPLHPILSCWESVQRGLLSSGFSLEYSSYRLLLNVLFVPYTSIS